MFLFLLFPFLLIHHSQATCSGKCKELTSLYEDINCIPLFDNPGDCCPVNFDCSHLLKKPKSDCILQGKLYKARQEVPRDETYGSCQIGCHCSNDGAFRCAVLDCPEHIGNRPLNNCTSKYVLDQCCAVGQICPPFDNLAKCEVDGHTYYEGQKFYPAAANEKCLSCVCQKGFKGEFVKPFCQKVKCLTELRNSAKIQENCAVVYIGDSACCPYTFICPKDHDFTIKKGKADSAKPSCLFGKDVLSIGDTFEISETFAGYHTIQTKCECRIPPFVTCVQRNIFDPEKTPEHIL